jgi:glutamate 5-kinase
VRADDPALEAMAGGAGSQAFLKGGMITKVRAARRAARSGADTVIASGREADVLPRLHARRGAGHLADRSATRRWPRASNGWPTICSWSAA